MLASLSLRKLLEGTESLAIPDLFRESADASENLKAITDRLPGEFLTILAGAGDCVELPAGGKTAPALSRGVNLKSERNRQCCHEVAKRVF